MCLSFLAEVFTRIFCVFILAVCFIIRYFVVFNYWISFHVLVIGVIKPSLKFMLACGECANKSHRQTWSRLFTPPQLLCVGSSRFIFPKKNDACFISQINLLRNLETSQIIFSFITKSMTKLGRHLCKSLLWYTAPVNTELKIYSFLSQDGQSAAPYLLPSGLASLGHGVGQIVQVSCKVICVMCYMLVAMTVCYRCSRYQWFAFMIMNIGIVTNNINVLIPFYGKRSMPAVS